MTGRMVTGRGEMARHEPRVRALASYELTDPEIGAKLDLTAKQVAGIRARAYPPIPSARPRGRPEGSKDAKPRRRVVRLP